MTQAVTAPVRTTRRGARLPRPLPADRFAGRWPATDQLVNGTAPTAVRPPAPAGPEAGSPTISAQRLESRADQDVQQRDIDVDAAEVRRQESEVQERDIDVDVQEQQEPGQRTDWLEIAAQPQPEFVERIAAITEQFTNPSTGETSVDRPLAVRDEHEAEYETEYERPARHLAQTGPRR